MAKVCHSCGKKPAFGNSRSDSMTATRRRFNPNLQKVRIQDGSSSRRVYVCARCLKSNKVTKAVEARHNPAAAGTLQNPMADPSIERFRRVVNAASVYLDDRRQEVNDLNVFPVADGDTGDNMALTLRAVADELDRLDGQMVDEIGRTELVDALARAALMGARGNSGVIPSQIVRGAAEELASRPGELARSGAGGGGDGGERPTPRTSRSAIPPRARC